MTLAVVVWPLLVLVAGLLVYAFASERLGRLGLVAFAVGLFWLVGLMVHAKALF